MSALSALSALNLPKSAASTSLGCAIPGYLKPDPLDDLDETLDHAATIADRERDEPLLSMLGRASALPSLSGLAVLRPKFPEIRVLVERLDASDLDAWDALEIPRPDAVLELGARIRRLELARRELGRRPDGGLALFIESVGERRAAA